MEKIIRKIELPLAKLEIKAAGLYIVQKKDIDRLAQVAADAYRDDPLYAWFTKVKYDVRNAEQIMRNSLKIVAKDALIYADSEEINGFAIWLPCGLESGKILPFPWNGGFRQLCQAGPGVVSRRLAYESYVTNRQKEGTDRYDWCLYNLSVMQDAQEQGIAGKLMKPMLRFCDEERMVAYLETNRGVTASLYQQYGFDLKREEQIPKTPVVQYSMIRYPKEE